MKYLLRSLVLAVGVFCGGCAPFELPRPIVDGSPVASDEAIIYMRANLLFYPPSVNSPAALGTSIATSDVYPAKAYPIVLKPGSNMVSFKVLPAGYAMFGIGLPKSFATFGEHADFVVKAGRINYLGDLTIVVDWEARQYRMEHARRGSEARSEFLANFPKTGEGLQFEDAVVRVGTTK